MRSGKIYFSGSLDFNGFEGPDDKLAVFQESDGMKRLLRMSIDLAYRRPFDACLGSIVHDLRVGSIFPLTFFSHRLAHEIFS